MFEALARNLPAICIAISAAAAHAQENWPQWRGPDATGVAKAENLPLTWSETENIVWKTPLPSWSGATPVIWNDRIFVPSPSKPEPGDSSDAQAGGAKLLLLCISKQNGAILWQRELDDGNTFHSIHNDSSPSPVTDGQHVWTVTGTGAVVALTMEGEIVWKHNLQKDYSPFGLNFGYASSPLLFEGKLIVEVLHGLKTDAASYVVAFDALTGNVLWHVERQTAALLESRDAYTTPALLRHDGKNQIIISGGDIVTAHDPETGKEIWRAGGLNPKDSTKNRIVVSPIVVDGLIYAQSTKSPFLVFRAGGEGDVTTSHLAWKIDKFDGPDVPTPACDGTYLYILNDRGLITCYDAKTGAIKWGPERTAQGIVSASPLLADGKVYVTNEAAMTTVLAAGPEFKILASNKLPSEGKTLSSFAVSGSRLFLRTPTALYCIGK